MTLVRVWVQKLSSSFRHFAIGNLNRKGKDIRELLRAIWIPKHRGIFHFVLSPVMWAALDLEWCGHIEDQTQSLLLKSSQSEACMGWGVVRPTVIRRSML